MKPGAAKLSWIPDKSKQTNLAFRVAQELRDEIESIFEAECEGKEDPPTRQEVYAFLFEQAAFYYRAMTPHLGRFMKYAAEQEMSIKDALSVIIEKGLDAVNARQEPKSEKKPKR